MSKKKQESVVWKKTYLVSIEYGDTLTVDYLFLKHRKAEVVGFLHKHGIGEAMTNIRFSEPSFVSTGVYLIPRKEQNEN